MLKAINAVFDLLYSFMMFIKYLVTDMFQFIAKIPSILSYITNIIGGLPTVISAILITGLGFLIIKSIHKYM